MFWVYNKSEQRFDSLYTLFVWMGKRKRWCVMAEILQQQDLMGKLTILSDAAKYDVACTSSGVERKGNGRDTGNTYGAGICHAFTSDGRCISLLKILFTNECIYDCRYCINRRSNDVPRTSFTPDEVCRLTMEFYRRNYIEGLFLSSGIIHSPDYTMGLLYETLFLLRSKYRFNGYIHIKGIPGASADIVEMTGYLCDRMSVNLELPTAEGLRQIAPNKVRQNILKPMRQIQNGIRESRQYHGGSSMQARVSVDERTYYDQLAEIRDSGQRLEEYHRKLAGVQAAAAVAQQSWQLDGGQGTKQPVRDPQEQRPLADPSRYFVPAGQSTQMIIGATDETDYQIMSVTEALYKRFDMKRVFYSAFVNVNMDERLPGIGQKPQLLREHRLYQADFLLRFYGFAAGELLSEKNPNFHELLDPKCNWAIHHLELFPVEINRADYYTLLRVPGIGTKSAKRILAARKHTTLRFEDIKRLGVVLKRALYFITCDGRMMYQTKLEEDYITRHLIYNERPNQLLLDDGSRQTYEQLNFLSMIS